MQIPKYKEIYESIVSDIEAEFQISLPGFGVNYFRAFAAVQAAKIWLLYSLAAKVHKNIFVDTAEPEAAGGTLERFGRVKLNRNPNPAQQALYDIEVQGNANATIPQGTVWQSDDSATNPGINYVLDAAFALNSSGQATVTVRALTAGLDGKQVPGNTMSLTSPLAAIQDTASIVSEAQPPVRAETIEQYRQKTMQAFRIEPNGGSAGDFRLWGLDVNGVVNIYPYTQVNPPSQTNLEIFVEADPSNAPQGGLEGEAPNSMLQLVRDAIKKDPDTSKSDVERARLPIAAYNFEVKSVKALEIEVKINGYDDPGNNKSEIEQALKRRAANTRPFIAGIDAVRERQDVLNVNNIIFEIQNINPRIRFNSVDLIVNGNLQTDGSYQFGVDQLSGQRGEIPVIRQVTYA
jgi:hypothetical protein